MNRDHVDLCVTHEFPARYLHGGSKQVLSFSFPGEKSGDFFLSRRRGHKNNRQPGAHVSKTVSVQLLSGFLLSVIYIELLGKLSGMNVS